MSEKTRCCIYASAKLQDYKVSFAKLSANFSVNARAGSDRKSSELSQLRTILREAHIRLNRLKSAGEAEWREINETLSQSFYAFDSLRSRLAATDTLHNEQGASF